MSEFFGNGVSRTLSAKARQFVSLVWQRGKPPLDAEFNLLTQVAEDARQSLLAAHTPSGWVGDAATAAQDYGFDPQASNLFYFGHDRGLSEGDVMWAVVNGWPIPVAGTQSASWRNAIFLPPPPASPDPAVNFVFLEVWKAQVAPAGTVNKPAPHQIYRYGNVEFGGEHLDNDLLDPALLMETTQRVQLQYRLRVVPGVSPADNPYGFGPGVRAQGAQAQPVTSSDARFAFANMGEELGDPGLWRAGDGDGENGLLGTVDGYAYAIPLCMVFRRTVFNWNRLHQHGAVNRNPAMVDRRDARVLPSIALAADAGPADMTLVLNATQGATTLRPDGGLVRVGDEIVAYSAYSGTTLTVSERGAKATYARAHKAGEPVNFVTGHPLGLFSDQIAEGDVLDLRHMVAPAPANYQSLLERNLDKLLRGELTTTWARSQGNVKGREHFQIDYLGPNATAPDFTLKGDRPDGFRKVFSDACALQSQNLVVLGTAPTSSAALDYSLNPATTLYRSEADRFTTNDVIVLDLAQYKNTFAGSDQNKVRFVHPFEYDGCAHCPVTMWLGVDPDRTVYRLASQDPNPLFMVLGTVVPDAQPAPSAGTANVTFSTSGDYGVVAIAGVDFSQPHESGLSVGDYLAESEAWALLLGNAAGSPENHGAFRIVGDDGTGALLVTRADGENPEFVPAEVQRTWSLRIAACSAEDADMAVALVKSDFQAPSNAALSMSYDLLYHPAAGLARASKRALHVDLEPGIAANYLRENDFSNAADSTVTAPDVKRAHVVPMENYPHPHHRAILRRDARLGGAEGAWAEAYVDPGSKTLVYQPVRNVLVRLDPCDVPAGDLGYADITGRFNTAPGAAQASILVPKELRPALGRQDVPFVTSKASVSTASTAPGYGINGIFLAGSADVNQGVVSSTSRMLGIYDTALAPDFGQYPNLQGLGAGPNENALTCRYYNKGGVRGIEIPAHYGIARLFAIYRREDFYAAQPLAQGQSNFSAASGYRVPSAAAGALRHNLLREDAERRSLIITEDNTFVIPEDAIDQTGFGDSLANTPLIVEFLAYFFDDWKQDLMRVHAVVGQTLGSSYRMFVYAPAASGDNVFVVGTRTPYQGNIHGTMPLSAVDAASLDHLDYTPRRDALTPAQVMQIVQAFAMEEDVRVPNRAHLPILAAVPFATTLGTGAIAGPVAQGSYTDVGYLDLAGYPFASTIAPKLASRVRNHATLANGLSLEMHVPAALVGASERLPLGAIVADHMLLAEGVGPQGERLWQPSWSMDAPVDYRYDRPMHKAMKDGSAVFSDGTSGATYGATANLYRTYRGGTLTVGGTGGEAGGAFVATGGRAAKPPEYAALGQDAAIHGGVLFGIAFLVRSAPQVATDNAVAVDMGGELQMLVVTGVTLGQELALLTGGPSGMARQVAQLWLRLHPMGAGEGYCAADRFRVEGRPLQKVGRNAVPASAVPVYDGRDPAGPIAPPSTDPCH